MDYSKSHRTSIRTVTNDKGCLLVVSHKPNADGYIRLHRNNKMEMYHRTVYKEFHCIDEIPDGFEVDHICRERNCCNPEHLQLLTNYEHTVKTNKERYSDRKLEAYEYWVTNKPTGTELGKLYGVTFSAACRLIRDWKKQLEGNTL